MEFRVALYPERAAANLRPQPGLGMGLGGPMGPMVLRQRRTEGFGIRKP